jgi:hypothetical protein
MKTKTKAAVALIASGVFAIVVLAFHTRAHAQAPATPTIAADQLVRYGPMCVRSKDIALVTHEDSKKMTTFYVIPAAGQPPLKIEFSGDDSMEAWKEFQQSPVPVPTQPSH